MHDDSIVNSVSSIKRLSSNKFMENICDLQNENADHIYDELFIGGSVENSVVEGVITAASDNDIIVDIGAKSSGRVLIKELGPNDIIEVGAKIKVYVERVEDYHGNLVLSREKAIRDEKWHALEAHLNANSQIVGVIKKSIKYGFIVDLGDGINAFLPLSHVGVKQPQDTRHIMDVEEQFVILKMDKSQGNIVVSRKLVIEKEYAGEKVKFLESLNEGDVVDGRVKSITHYGVFANIYESDKVSIDGLLYITDISWGKPEHPSTIFTCGQMIKAKIIKIDKENVRVSLGMKQLELNPWENIESKYLINEMYDGCVVSIEDYGIFVELERGIEGLVHLSEVSWSASTPSINSVVAKGDKIRVRILGIDTVKSRMSLSVKRCGSNPWQEFIEKHHVGSIVSGQIKNNTGVYLVISLDDSEVIEGVLYSKDLSWVETGHNEVKKYSVGSTVEAKIIRANVERGKIHLGIKQIERDPFEAFIRGTAIGDKVTVCVVKREDNGIIVEAASDVQIFIDQQNLPENRKFFISENLEADVLHVEEYKLILSIQ